MIEQIVSLENQHVIGSGFYFFRTQAGAEIDLLIDRGQTRIGFEFKAGASTIPRDWRFAWCQLPRSWRRVRSGEA